MRFAIQEMTETKLTDVNLTNVPVNRCKNGTMFVEDPWSCIGGRLSEPKLRCLRRQRDNESGVAHDENS